MFESQPDKLKTLMNKCSKHRQQFAPDAETPPGIFLVSNVNNIL